MANHKDRPKKIDAQELRRARFPQAIRGYDRNAVHELLDYVADYLEQSSPGAVADREPDVRRELERVGERTAGILTAAEEAAEKLREEAREYSEKVRREAEEEARATRLEASRKAEEIVSEAESRAERIVDEAIARRRKLAARLEELTQRRDEIAEEIARLADELMTAADALRSTAAPGEEEAPAQPAPALAADDVAEEPADPQATRTFAEVGEPEPDVVEGEEEPEEGAQDLGEEGPDPSSEPTRLYAVEDVDTAVHRTAPDGSG
ncbi:MAG TPA: DivIVA domain-containing protein [Solirubrobacterales bacterium]|jgi:DivIVA domain-containing protein